MFQYLPNVKLKEALEFLNIQIHLDTVIFHYVLTYDILMKMNMVSKSDLDEKNGNVYIF